MNVLVTGAAGLTGAAVVRELLARGHDVVGVVHRQDQLAMVPSPATAAVGDADDIEAMDPRVAAADAVCHVAGILASRGVAGPSAARPRSMAVVSTAALYTRYQPAVLRYRESEAHLTAARPDVLLIRPTMIYGSPRDRNVHRAVDFARRFHFLPVVGSGNGRLQPIHYADLARAIVLLLEYGATGIVDAGGAEPVTIRAAAMAILDALHLPRRVISLPFPAAKAAAGALDAVRGGRWSEKVDRTVEDRVVDNARLIELTGLRPRPFEHGVREQVGGL
jgi:nucleoside-diphosphate-sugar epimerase